MAFDGVFLYGLAKELEDALRGGRVDRIQQPEADEIHITVRNKEAIISFCCLQVRIIQEFT